MKTKEEMIKLGFDESWMRQCETCGSFDCHAFPDVIQCFDCKQRFPLPDKAMVKDLKEKRV